MKPLFIFDLDGTLALLDHRRHMLDADDREKWRRFYAACDKDLPNVPVIAIMDRLRYSGAEVWIFSGRSDEVRDKTVAWIAKHTSFQASELDTILVMRRAGDHRPDDELKQGYIDKMLDIDRRRLVAVFDDRDRVVKTWRINGITCLQVAEGNF